MNTITNCNNKNCSDLILHDKIKVDEKVYNKTSFICYNNKEKEKAFCSLSCKFEYDKESK